MDADGTENPCKYCTIMRTNSSFFVSKFPPVVIVRAGFCIYCVVLFEQVEQIHLVKVFGF